MKTIAKDVFLKNRHYSLGQSINGKFINTIETKFVEFEDSLTMLIIMKDKNEFTLVDVYDAGVIVEYLLIPDHGFHCPSCGNRNPGHMATRPTDRGVEDGGEFVKFVCLECKRRWVRSDIEIYDYAIKRERGEQ